MKITIPTGEYTIVVVKEGVTQITFRTDEVTVGRTNLRQDGYLVFVPTVSVTDKRIK